MPQILYVPLTQQRGFRNSGINGIKIGIFLLPKFFESIHTKFFKNSLKIHIKMAAKYEFGSFNQSKTYLLILFSMKL